MSERQFALASAISPEQLNRWVNDKNKPTYKTLVKLKTMYSDLPIDVDNPEQTLQHFTTNNSNAVVMDTSSSSIMNVPLVTEYAYAGYLSGYGDKEFMDELPTVPFIVEKEFKGNYMAFQVRGDSMNDGSIDSYLAGDIVLCREIKHHHWQNKLHINKWDFVIVHKDEGVLIKKIVKHNTDDGSIVAHSINPIYEDIKINLNDIIKLFNVVKVERTK